MKKEGKPGFLSRLFWFVFDAILYTSVVFPYVMYAYAYKNPAIFTKYLDSDGFAFVSIIFKVVSVSFLLIAGLKSGINNPGVFIGIPLLAVGQYLNSKSYEILGKKGIYYGYEFGELKFERFEGFPFTLTHPQYKGSLLTVIGCLFICNVSKRTTIACMLWAVAYLVIIAVEATEPGPLAGRQ